ncbi:hypothetical protein HNO88_004361 [Novosphingobium chloroacetimidivorans]|uniref:Stability/partitioning determinant n=1 Tax=Novosphingobium chloroacetimidivorans TaxID=1428314 RepID=A0A7W7KF16_9SPHN|nr:hypothetical protein [Novosphingobium chloroacetimidivorans]
MSSTQRASIFDDADEKGPAPDAFRPTPKKAPSSEELKALDEAAARHNFLPRDPSPRASRPSERSQSPRRGKGPKVQLNLRIAESLKERFQSIVDATELRHETVFRMALEALERDLNAK